jgi:pyruvate kinase
MIRFGNLVVVTAGSLRISGTTNMMIVRVSVMCWCVVIRRKRGQRVHGKIAILLSSDDRKGLRAKERIVVLTRCDESYLPLLKKQGCHPTKPPR